MTNNNRYIRFSLVAAALALVFLASCQMPGLLPTARSAEGSVNIQVATENPKTLVPGIDMTVASYVVSGTGPSAASFSTTIASASTTINGLAVGSWLIAADGKNAAGTVISHGETTTAIATGSTQTVSISASPIVGQGSLTLAVSWAAAAVQAPSIQAQLTPSQGSSTNLVFSTPASGSATYSGTGIQNGYYTLTVKLYDGTQLVAGAVEVAWIVAGQTTSGSFDFTGASAGSGSILVNITPQMANPLSVSLAGGSASIATGVATTLTAATTGYSGNVTYVWYLNGISKGTGSSFSFNAPASALVPGNYRLDVTAFSTDGTRAGSASSAFTVVNAASVKLAWNSNTETNIAGYKLYVGTVSGVYAAPVDVGLVTTYTATGLLGGTTYYIALAAYNSSGMESGKSAEISYVAP